MSERVIRHRTLPVSAPECFWRAMGWQVYTNTDEAGERCHHGSGADTLLAVALTHGLEGEKALGYVVTEWRRETEERTRATALAREADAIAALAHAIKADSEQALVARIMGRLTQKTQWALRQQLAGTGLLPGN